MMASYATASFYIEDVLNGTNNDDGTITPDTPNSLTALSVHLTLYIK